MATVEFAVAPVSAKRIRAVEYVRMSTEHQQYSIANQREKLREYAAAHDIEVIRAYEDGGKSGVTIKHRAALQKLIADVSTKSRDFDVVLVYDVSRWGRFQDADESAHYEYCCKCAGVRVIYCAEQFDNDGSPVASIVKGVKRVMAGEFSRELSVKVTAGQKRLAQMGYRLGGGSRVFGYKSILVTTDGRVIGEIGRAERKAVQTHHVVLGLGNDKEAAAVAQCFEWFTKKNVGEVEIAKRLNEAGVLRMGKPWSDGAVHSMLINSVYLGHSVFGKTTTRLGGRPVKNAPKDWIMVENTHPPIVSASAFKLAQQRIAQRPRKQYSKAELLAALRETLSKHGYLSTSIIDSEPLSPSSTAYFKRFGSLFAAYKLINYIPERECIFTKINHAIEKRFPGLAVTVGEKYANRGSSADEMANYCAELAQGYAEMVLRVQASDSVIAGVHGWRQARSRVSLP